MNNEEQESLDTEDWKALKKIGQEKRRSNLEFSTNALREKGIEFESYNAGYHLLVRGHDFWPSTGKFRNRKTGKLGRGLNSLLKEISDE